MPGRRERVNCTRERRARDENVRLLVVPGDNTGSDERWEMRPLEVRSDRPDLCGRKRLVFRIRFQKCEYLCELPEVDATPRRRSEREHDGALAMVAQQIEQIRLPIQREVFGLARSVVWIVIAHGSLPDRLV